MWMRYLTASLIVNKIPICRDRTYANRSQEPARGDTFVSFATAVVPTLFSWLKRRSEVEKRKVLLDEAIKLIGFWHTWLKVQLSLDLQADERSETQKLARERSSQIRSAIDLISISPHFLGLPWKPSSEEFIARRDRLSLIRRLLLLYEPKRSAGWFFRVTFGGNIFGVVLSLLPSPNTSGFHFADYRDIGIAVVGVFTSWSAARTFEGPR